MSPGAPASGRGRPGRRPADDAPKPLDHRHQRDRAPGRRAPEVPQLLPPRQSATCMTWISSRARARSVKRSALGAEGTERERPATGYRNHVLASELPHQPQTLNLHHNKPDLTEARATTCCPHATVTPAAHGIGVKGAAYPRAPEWKKTPYPVRPTLRILHLTKWPPRAEGTSQLGACEEPQPCQGRFASASRLRPGRPGLRQDDRRLVSLCRPARRRETW